MFSVFSVRVLIERHKLSQELLSSLHIDGFGKKVLKPVTWLNSHRIEELYDLAKPTRKVVKPLFLCNQIIHSYILLPVQDGKEFSHILVCSDYERNRFLSSVPIPGIVSLLRAVASDHPSRMDVTFNPKRNDYDVRSYQ